DAVVVPLRRAFGPCFSRRLSDFASSCCSALPAAACFSVFCGCCCGSCRGFCWGSYCCAARASCVRNCFSLGAESSLAAATPATSMPARAVPVTPVRTALIARCCMCVLWFGYRAAVPHRAAHAGIRAWGNGSEAREIPLMEKEDPHGTVHGHDG